MLVVTILGLAMTAVALPIAGRRVWFLYRLITSGQPAPDRVENVTERLGQAVRTELVEVFGQRKLLKWSIPGAAHFFVFWAFLILASVYLEAYGSLISPGFHIPVIGHWPVLGFLQDFIALMAFFGIVAFAIIRLQNSPDRLGRKSRFKGSHLGGAWITLFMIFNVIWSMFLFRGASINAGNFPYDSGAFMSEGVSNLLEPLGTHANEVLEGVGLLIHIGVMLVFLIFVLNSKHLHIFIAPLNVVFGRRPVALGAMKPMMNEGKPLDFENLDDMDEDTVMGVGNVEDFSWKGLLDFATCTECGRCQSQCPAWNTEKPLSPKLMIMELRDHAFQKAPYLLASSDEERESLPDAVKAEAERELVGATEGDPSMPSGGAVIDPDVLWSCVSCGACVQQCPVDIEHVDHIMDMRRYQVLVESNFPTELNQLFKGMENKGNPWNMSPKARMDWAKDLDFEVKQVGVDVEDLDEVDWLFWVGCAGAYEDRAKKTTRAVAELLDLADVSFAVLGDGETCTGDPARRAGNEFVFQQLAMQNAEVFKETKVKKVVSTCAHCFNTLKNEYAQFGVELEVVHHTQLLNRLVREGRLTPVAENGSGGRAITYHDPCYLGRHNQVYSPPRELLDVLPNAEYKEMPRHGERSFCCGGGGARMWMEENLGQRINVNRTTEAVETGADQIATGCPFCRVMLSDGLTAKQADGSAREEVEVLDVAQLLLASVKRADAPAPPADPAPSGGGTPGTDGTATAAAGAATATAVLDRPGEGEGAAPDGQAQAEPANQAEPAPAAQPEAEPVQAEPVETKAEPEPGDVTQSEETVTATEEVGANASAAEETHTEETDAGAAQADSAETAEPTDSAGSAGSSNGQAGERQTEDDKLF